MPRTLTREPQLLTVDEYFSEDTDLPEKMELWDGEVGPFSDTAKLALMANWGADKILALTGPEIWLEAIAAAASKG